jgi:hypothetical protein
MTNTTNTANSRFAVAYGSAFLYAAVLFFFGVASPVSRPLLARRVGDRFGGLPHEWL